MKAAKYLCAVVLGCCCFTLSFSQKRNNIWCFGDSAGIDFNFSPIPIYTSLNTRGSCSSICDTIGQLLFYSAYDTTSLFAGSFPIKVYNKNHVIMQNGDSMKGKGWYNEITIVDDPSADSMYYLFHIGVTVNYGIYYSKVDLSLNGGLGAVVQKNIQLQSFANVDCLNAIKHGNGRDWWVFFRPWVPSNPLPGNNEFHSYLITPAGVTNYTVQNVGSLNYTGLGKLTFSAQGNKAAFASYAGLLEIYDFNRCTGVISNPVNIFQQATMPPYNHFWGCEFSPNGKILYVSVNDLTSYLLQFDLSAPNIAASIDTLWQTSYPTEAIGALKRGPDNKIYVSGPYTNPSVFIYPYPDSMYNMYNMNLGVINYPDSLGAACDFQPYSFYLGGKRTYWGLPNNPDYDMGALAGSPCDTLTNLTPGPSPQERGAELFVTWVGSWQKLFVNAQHLKGRNVTVEVFDVAGKNLTPGPSPKERGASPDNGYFTQDVYLPELAAGLYVVSLRTEKEFLTKKFVKE